VTSTAANAGDSARCLHQAASGRRFRGFLALAPIGKSERRGICIGADMASPGREKVLVTPPLNHGALRKRGPFTSVALITRAHEAVKQRLDIFTSAYLMARSSILV
jgi:hypothetical protein